MMIFDEEAYTDELLELGLQSPINRRDLILIARWLKSQGMDDATLKEVLDGLCEASVEDYISAKYEDLILDVVKAVAGNQERRSKAEVIFFSAEELQSIIELQNEDAERLLYIMMCICKTYGRDNIYLNSQSTIKLNELCDLACTKCAKKNQDYLLYELHKNHKICVKNLTFINISPLTLKDTTQENAEIRVKPSEDMIDDFETWVDKHYTKCARCKKRIPRTNNRVKYCEECARIVNIEKTASNRKASKSNT